MRTEENRGATRENDKMTNDLCRRKRLRSDARPRSIVLLVLVSFLALLSFPDRGTLVLAADDDYNGNDDANNNQNDDAVANDDANNQGDDFYADNDDNYQYDEAANGEGQYRDLDDDTFHWNANVGFDGVSVMPISCIN